MINNITSDQVKILVDAINESFRYPDLELTNQVISYICDEYGIKSFNEFKQDEFDNIVKEVQEYAEEYEHEWLADKAQKWGN